MNSRVVVPIDGQTIGHARGKGRGGGGRLGCGAFINERWGFIDPSPKQKNTHPVVGSALLL